MQLFANVYYCYFAWITSFLSHKHVLYKAMVYMNCWCLIRFVGSKISLCVQEMVGMGFPASFNFFVEASIKCSRYRHGWPLEVNFFLLIVKIYLSFHTRISYLVICQYILAMRASSYSFQFKHTSVKCHVSTNCTLYSMLFWSLTIFRTV